MHPFLFPFSDSKSEGVSGDELVEESLRLKTRALQNTALHKLDSILQISTKLMLLVENLSMK